MNIGTREPSRACAATRRAIAALPGHAPPQSRASSQKTSRARATRCAQVSYQDDGQLMVTIYYWEHDQAEERPLQEFFRGVTSLIQWQPPLASALHAMPVAGVPVAGMPMQQHLQGLHDSGAHGPHGVAPMYGMPHDAALMLQQAGR